jgi:ATP-binding cassette, subfamily F, member 3
MLTAHQVSKSFGINSILEGVSFSINAGERVGLIGPNGSGKTTLLRILAGIELPDQGSVTLARSDLRIGYLEQGYEPQPAQTIAQVIAAAGASPQEALAQLERLAAELALNPHDPNLQSAYDAALYELQVAHHANTDAILDSLGLSHLPPDTPVSILSGGQQTRLALARVLLQDPHLLLLDEPTNHLDIAMLEWLEGWLASFRGAALVVSHDRTFLDRTVNCILDLDPETHGVSQYEGNYTDYVEQYLSNRERQMQAYKDQVDEIRRLRQDIARTKQHSLQVELTTSSRQPGVRRYAKKVAKKALAREKKLDRFLNSDDRVQKPKESWRMKLDFDDPLHLGRDIFSAENLSVGYQGYSPLLVDLNLSMRAGQRIVLTGPNGQGKTTLLRTIAGVIPPLTGQVHVGQSVRLGYMTQDQTLPDAGSTPVEIIQNLAPINETDARTFLHYFLFSGDDALRTVELLSYGERARLALAVLVVQGCNFLLLDEPINHLDIPSRARFEQALAQFQGAVLAVVHDRYFIERFAAEMWLVDDRSLERIVLQI